jgi:hypothetical protein
MAGAAIAPQLASNRFGGPPTRRWMRFLISGFVTHMYGPAVRRKRSLRSGGLWSCINVSGITLERSLLRAIMDTSARAFSLADNGQANSLEESNELGHDTPYATRSRHCD